MSTLYDAIQHETDRQQAIQEAKVAEAKKRTFNLGSLLPALIAAPFTGGASLVSMGLPAALGEGVRASTGSDTDLASLASSTYNAYGPSVSSKIESTAKTPLGNVGGWLQDAAVLPKSKADQLADKLYNSGNYIASEFTKDGTKFTPSMGYQYSQLMGMGDTGNAMPTIKLLPNEKGLINPADKKPYGFDMTNPLDVTKYNTYKKLGWMEVK